MELPRSQDIFIVALAWLRFRREKRIPQIMAFQVNDVVRQYIFRLTIIALPGSQKNDGKGKLGQSFDYLMHPAGHPAPDKRVGALQQKCDISVFLGLLHWPSSARIALQWLARDKLREVLLLPSTALLPDTASYKKLFRRNKSISLHIQFRESRPF